MNLVKVGFMVILGSVLKFGACDNPAAMHSKNRLRNRDQVHDQK